ncbi:MAG: hypothetical protein AABX66_00635 [Nanoarchaeota archaeon]
MSSLDNLCRKQNNLSDRLNADIKSTIFLTGIAFPIAVYSYCVEHPNFDVNTTILGSVIAFPISIGVSYGLSYLHLRIGSSS